MKNKKIFVIALAAGLMVLRSCILFAQEEGKQEKPKAKTMIKTIEGQVSAVNKNGIAVVYSRDLAKGLEKEIFLPLDNSIRLVHKKRLEDISVGDTVSVQYEEVTRGEAKEGLVKTLKGITVTFLKPAPKKPEVPVMESEEGENE
ncbi:MAG: hypothetical protein PHP73_06850 [Candidatus Omnitrophica bacterium]|nr:hypothetical protein [Candidatus Omnitrophota bacterium]